MTRREWLKQIAALAAWGALGPAVLGSARAAAPGEGRPFSRDWLKEQARQLSLAPFQAPVDQLPGWVAGLDWDGYQSIRYRPEHSLWAPEGLPFQARLFHLGLFFRHPVELYEVVEGVARPIHYSATGSGPRPRTNPRT
jgi:glucans biosynthesis protein